MLAIVLPVVLMLIRAIGELTLDDGTTTRNVLDFVGEPAVALLVGVLVAMLTVGPGVRHEPPADQRLARLGAARPSPRSC